MDDPQLGEGQAERGPEGNFISEISGLKSGGWSR